MLESRKSQLVSSMFTWLFPDTRSRTSSTSATFAMSNSPTSRTVTSPGDSSIVMTGARGASGDGSDPACWPPRSRSDNGSPPQAPVDLGV